MIKCEKKKEKKEKTGFCTGFPKHFSYKQANLAVEQHSLRRKYKALQYDTNHRLREPPKAGVSFCSIHGSFVLRVFRHGSFSLGIVYMTDKTRIDLNDKKNGAVCLVAWIRFTKLSFNADGLKVPDELAKLLFIPLVELLLDTVVRFHPRTIRQNYVFLAKSCHIDGYSRPANKAGV